MSRWSASAIIAHNSALDSFHAAMSAKFGLGANATKLVIGQSVNNGAAVRAEQSLIDADECDVKGFEHLPPEFVNGAVALVGTPEFLACRPQCGASWRSLLAMWR